MNNLDKHSRISTASICLMFVWPLALAIVNYYCVQIITGYGLCVLYFLCTFLTYRCYGNFRLEMGRDMVFLLSFLLTTAMIYIAANEYVLLYNFIFDIPIYLFCIKYVEVKDRTFQKAFLWIVGISITVTMVMTINTLRQYPGASRVLASNSFEKYGANKYRKMGSGGFDFIYTLVLLVPVAITASIKSKGINKIIAVAVSVGMIVTILLSGYTTAILLMSVACILLLCSVNKLTLGITIVLLPVVIWGYLTFRSEISNWLIKISEQFSSQSVQGHLEEIADIIAQRSDVGDLNRTQLYLKSFDAFLRHPIIGAYISEGSGSVGGHSTLLDLLGGCGLIVFFLYTGFLTTWYFRIARSLMDRWVRTGWKITSLVYVALQLVNPIFSNYLIIFAYMSIAVGILKACTTSREIQ